MIIHHNSNHSFETRPDRSTRDLADPELELDRIEKKIKKKKPDMT